jgi:hypothetical protein
MYDIMVKINYFAPNEKRSVYVRNWQSPYYLSLSFKNFEISTMYKEGVITTDDIFNESREFMKFRLRTFSKLC